MTQSPRIAELLATLPLEAKVAQLVGYMPDDITGEDEAADRATLREALPHGVGAVSAILEMGRADPGSTARRIDAVQRYLVEEAPGGIPALVHAEALNGFVYAGALQFPTPIGMAATFRPDHARFAAGVAARQMRALGIQHALSPVLDVARDPRFGRVHETYGEDPHLCAAFGVEAVRGLQGSARPVLATGKHFLGYPASEAGLNMASVHLGPRELREVHALPFEAAVRHADLATVMNSYAAVDGVPSAVSHELLTLLLRDELGFEGPVVADYGSVGLASTLHGLGSMREVAIRALAAGLDVELPVMDGFSVLVAAVRDGNLDEALVDQAVARVLTAKAQIGLLAGAAPRPLAASHRATDEEAERASATAVDSLVLLRNREDRLPLADGVRRLAVLGPFADRLRPLFAGYSGPAGMEIMRYAAAGAGGTMAGVSAEDDGGSDIGGALASRTRVVPDDEIEAAIRQLHPDARTVAEACRDLAPRRVAVEVERGVDHLEEDLSGIPAAVALAQQADVAVCVVGEKTGWVGDATAGEGRDRASLDLLGGQRALVEAVAGTGTPVVAVLLCGRPLEIGWLEDLADAILLAWHPGTAGGDAVGAALWGAVNPGGKLPVTFPRSVGHLPSHSGQRVGSGYRRPDGRAAAGHIDAPAAPRFPFGHGLSYTQFEIGELELADHRVPVGGTVVAAATVTNVGDRPGDEVVQFYGHDVTATVTRPVRQLVGFERVTLGPGETCRLVLSLDPAVFALWGTDDRWHVEPGAMQLLVGRSSDDILDVQDLELTGQDLVLDHRTAFLGTVRVDAATDTPPEQTP